MQNSLRIALILETSGGGSGRHVLDLARGLAALGHRVTIIWSPIRAEADFISQMSGILGISTLEVPMARAVGLGDITSLKALAGVLRGGPQFDILHAHSSKAGALVRLLPSAITGARIYTPHAFRTMDPNLGWLQRQIYGTIERFLAPRAARIIAVSRAEQQHAQSLGIDPDRVRVVVNGAALPFGATRATARKAMQLKDGDVAVGFIGRLESQKDPLRFVAAVVQAARTAPDIRGIVIGDGSLRDAAQEIDTNGNVHFMGWQDAPALICGLDIFCMTSQYEAMPYTLIEALHGGVPIITTGIGGAEETVVDGENGYILPVSSPQNDIADRIAALARDTQLRADFGIAGAELAKTRTINAMVTQTLTVYSDAITASATGRPAP